MREKTLGFALRSAKDLDDSAAAEGGGRADESEGRWW